MNTELIRIRTDTKKQIDVLMQQGVKDLFEKSNIPKINKILKHGYSYADFVSDLILFFKEHNKGKPH